MTNTKTFSNAFDATSFALAIEFLGATDVVVSLNGTVYTVEYNGDVSLPEAV